MPAHLSNDPERGIDSGNVSEEEEMNIIKCVYCQQTNHAQDLFCQFCGAPLDFTGLIKIKIDPPFPSIPPRPSKTYPMDSVYSTNMYCSTSAYTPMPEIPEPFRMTK